MNLKDYNEFYEIMKWAKRHLTKADKCTTKKNNETAITKYKLRIAKYLYTLNVYDTSEAEKIMQSIPPDLKKNNSK